MKTSKPFSTISYNTIDYLRIKLDDLVKRQVLSFYCFVKHYAEEDETKDHIHLLCIPNGTYQTDPLRDYLLEANPNDFEKPFGIMPCQSSKFDDWYLYACHDSAYLMSKNQARKHHYTIDDFVSSNPDYLLELVHTIDRSKYAKTKDFIDAINSGKSFSELLNKGYIPVSQFNQWLNTYNYLKEFGVFRSDRVSHTPKYKISEDGELIPILSNPDLMPFEDK